MGKCKDNIIISGLNIHDSNRGTAALGYGSISFLFERGYLKEGQRLVNFRIYKNPFKKANLKDFVEIIEVEGIKWEHKILCISIIETFLLKKWGLLLPFSRFRKVIKNTDLVAAINGGDGFSDIYNTKTFYSRLSDIEMAMRMGMSLILLPQTLGPFEYKSNFDIAVKILKYAKMVYVRDEKFVKELKQIGVRYERTKDLSYYMKPQPWEVDIKERAIGINISGLAYSNKYRTLTGQFEHYPELVDCLITHFRDKGHVVYLIPHSYIYGNPEPDNDDMVACRQAYERLEDKTNVVLVDKNLISPQVKYVISKMSFFIGTRMHANFAAIYTGVPVFGLAYSYKFQGAFDANGLNGEKQTVMINNIETSCFPDILSKIDNYYLSIASEM